MDTTKQQADLPHRELLGTWKNSESHSWSSIMYTEGKIEDSKTSAPKLEVWKVRMSVRQTAKEMVAGLEKSMAEMLVTTLEMML